MNRRVTTGARDLSCICICTLSSSSVFLKKGGIGLFAKESAWVSRDLVKKRECRHGLCGVVS